MDKFYSDASSSRGVSFSDREKRCSDHFNALLQRYGGVWHVFTPGISTEVLNLSERDYRFSVSNMAISAEEAGLVVLTDAHMSNHIHALFLGERSGCFRFIETAMRIIRQHRIGAFAAHTECFAGGLKQRLVIVCPQGGGFVMLHQSATTTWAMPAPDFQCDRFRLRYRANAASLQGG